MKYNQQANQQKWDHAESHDTATPGSGGGIMDNPES
jgi:hypothetical protein